MQGYNLSVYCGNNPVNRIDVSGADSLQIDEEQINLGDKDNEGGATPGGAPSGDTITVYRAMSPSEYNSTVSTGKFSAGPNSYESGKYFATSYNNATQWGDKMYHDGNYKVLQATFDSRILNSSESYYCDRLDGIGPAHFFGIADANIYIVKIH